LNGMGYGGVYGWISIMNVVLNPTVFKSNY